MTSTIPPLNNAVMNCLAGLLSADRTVRSSAEDYLNQLESQAGFGPEMANVALHDELPAHVRQLACIILKNFVRSHWVSRGNSRFVAPEASASDKAAVKSIITRSLGAVAVADSKLRTAVAMVVTAVMHWEWPRGEWPACFSELVACLRSPDQRLARGALRCLDLFIGSDSLGESGVPEVVSQLFPELLRVFVSPDAFDPWMRIRVAVVFHSCVQWLSIHRTGEKRIAEIFGTNLPSWIAAFAAVIASPYSSEEDVGIRTIVVETLSALFSNFPSFVKTYVAQLVPHLWASLNAAFPDYERGVVFDSSLVGEPDEEGEVTSVVKVVNALLECFGVIVEKQAFRSALQSRIVTGLVQLTIGFMQMTAEQTERWAHDHDAFVQEEDDDTFSMNIRVVGKSLVQLVSESFSEGTLICWQAINERLSQASAMRQANYPHWWRLREAALAALCGIADSVTQAVLSGSMAADLPSFFASLLAMDIAPVAGQQFHQVATLPQLQLQLQLQQQQQRPPPWTAFLAGRAIHCAAEMIQGVSVADAMPFVMAVTTVLAQRRDLVLTVCACKAAASFCPKLPAASLAPFMPGILTGIASLLASAAASSSEDTLALVLTTLAVSAGVSPEAMTIYEPAVSTALLQVWAAKPADALLADDVAEVFKRIMQHPPCVPGLMERLLPTLALVIAESERYPGLVISSIDILQSLVLSVQTPESPTLATAFRQAFSSLVKFMLAAPGDSETLDLGCTCLRSFLLKFGQRILEWGPAAQGMLNVVTRLLDPSVAESRAAEVAPLVGEIISKFSQQLGGALDPLLQFVLRRLSVARESATVMPLVNVFALVAVDHAQWLVEFLSRTNEKALSFVMSKWISHHADLRQFGHFQVKQSVVALVKLLLLRDKRIEETEVEITEEAEEAEEDEGDQDGEGSQQRTEVSQKAPPVRVLLPAAILRIICSEYKRSDWESSMESTDDQPPGQQPSKKKQHHLAAAASLSEGDGGDDEEEDEEEEEDTVSAEVIDQLKGQGTLFAAAEDFAGYGDDGDEDDEEDGEAEDKDIAFVQGNPVFKIDLKQYIEQELRAAAASPGNLEFLKGLYFRLSAEERPIFDVLWSRAKAKK